jgi:glycosyltransferase involved in cell wall biosynthesis
VRLAIVGPTHPYKGGIAHHTTELAHRLAAAGHEVDLVSWSAQYPQLLYPGQRVSHSDPPELPPYERTSYPLAWYRPDGWWRVAAGLRDGGYDAVVLVVVTPVQVPGYLTMQAALRRTGRGGRRPRIVALCHNVLPHEARFFDRRLARAVLARADAVLVHSAPQAALAAELTPAPVKTASLPPHLPARRGEAPGAPATGGTQHRMERSGVPPTDTDTPTEEPRRRLLFFGIVRPYKGLDVLLRALAEVPDVRLTVAGEFWGGTEKAEALLAELGIADRVRLRPGYVPGEAIPGLFADADALVLPYRSGTASQNVWLAHEHGLPTIATRAGTLGDAVRDGVDGILCEPDDVAGLAAALRRFYEPGMPQRLRAGVRPVDPGPAWTDYLAVFESAVTGSLSRRR